MNILVHLLPQLTAVQADTIGNSAIYIAFALIGSTAGEDIAKWLATKPHNAYEAIASILNGILEQLGNKDNVPTITAELVEEFLTWWLSRNEPTIPVS